MTGFGVTWRSGNRAGRRMRYAHMPLKRMLMALAFFMACGDAVQHVLAAAQRAGASPAASSRNATPTLSVSGTVLDPSGAAIFGALVTLRASARENDRSTHADAIGNFRFDDVNFFF